MLSKTVKVKSVNTKADSHQKMIYLTTTGLFAALICITTAYIFHIPVGTNGGYVHVGDALIYLAAAILPAPYAMAAAALGGAIADLMTAPVWAVATLIIKMLLAIPFTSKKDKIINAQNVISIFIASVITIVGYYLAEVILFGSWIAILPSITGSIIQAAGSGILFLAFGHALDKMHFKAMLKNKFQL